MKMYWIILLCTMSAIVFAEHVNVSINVGKAMVTADTYVREDYPNNNYGTHKILGIENSDTSHRKYNYVQVNISNETQIENITSMYLKLSYNASDDWESNNNIKYYCCPDGIWDELVPTWNNRNVQFGSCSLISATFKSNKEGYDYYDTKSCMSSDEDSSITIMLTGGDGVGLSDDLWYDTREGGNVPMIELYYLKDTFAPDVTQANHIYWERNTNVTFTTDENASCRYAFSDIDYDSMTADVTSAITEHWFNYSNLTVNSNNTIHISCIDSFGNKDNATTNHDSWIYLQNNPMNISLSIQPSQANASDNITCVNVTTDDDGDALSAYSLIWYMNGVHNTSFDNSSTLSDSDVYGDYNYTCQYSAFDGYNWSTENSSTMTIGDSTAPVFVTCSVQATANENDIVNYCCQVTDDNFMAKNYPIFDIESPGSTRANYTYSLSAGDNYCKALTVGSPGTYTWHTATAMDGSGNSAVEIVNKTTYVIAAPITGGGGGSMDVPEGCGFDIIEPGTANHKIIMYGKTGYESSRTFSIQNTEPINKVITFRLSNELQKDCKLNIASYEVPGDSYIRNTVSCVIKDIPLNGNIIVEYLGCTQALPVEAKETGLSNILTIATNLFQGQGSFWVYGLLLFIPLTMALFIGVIGVKSS